MKMAVALCGAIQNRKKCQKRENHDFVMFSRNPMKMAVALCGAIQNAKKCQKR